MNYPDIHVLLGIIAGIISVVAFFPYIVSILRKETTPNRVTWFVWTTLGWLTLASYTGVGADTTLWFAWGYAVAQSVVFLLSIRLGEGGWSKFDLSCLAISAVGLITWGITDSAFYGLVLFLVADLFAALPTIKKSINRPHSESRLAWTMSAFAAVLNMIAVDRLEFEIIVYPLYFVITSGSIALILWNSKKKR